MKRLLSILFLLLLNNLQMNAQNTANRQYAQINGLDIYYEIHGSGMPLVLLHGGGSTIASNYGRILPLLAQTHQVIAIELQAHGHTGDREQPLSFEQDADDVAALLQHLGIDRADIMGFSNGGTTALQLGIRHPQMVRKLVLASATAKRSGMQPGFFEGMQQASLDNMPPPLKQAYKEANPDPDGLQTMFQRDVERMLQFKDIPDEAIRSVKAPTLIINGDRDVIRNEHALELSQLMPHARLLILPAGHGDYIGEICAPDKDSKMPEQTVALITGFLAE